jgi:hypothetical protein
MDSVCPFVNLCVFFVDGLLDLIHFLRFQLCESSLVLLDFLVPSTFFVIFQ